MKPTSEIVKNEITFLRKHWQAFEVMCHLWHEGQMEVLGVQIEARQPKGRTTSVSVYLIKF